MPEQVLWAEHAAYMNALVDQGFLVLGGPLGDGTQVLLIVNADNEADIHARLAADPWTPMGLLPIATVEVWQILLGELTIG